MMAWNIVVVTHTMLLKLFLVSTALTVLCNGKKDTSCDFTSGMCGWKVHTNTYCKWTQKSNNVYKGNKGYLLLKGGDSCSSSIRWTFSMFDGYGINELTIQYYVVGTGTFKLFVSDDVLMQKDWTCQIQKGPRKRTARVAVIGDAKNIYIEGQVAKGSQIIITQIWNSLQGHKKQSECPPLPKTPAPTTPTTPPPTITPTSVIEMKNISTTSSQSITKFNTPKSNSITELSKSTGKISTMTTPKEKWAKQTIETDSSTFRNQRTSFQPNGATFKSTTLDKQIKSTTDGITTAKTQNIQPTMPTSAKIKEEKSKKRKMIIGVVVGILTFFILIAFIVYFIKWRKQKQINFSIYNESLTYTNRAFE